MHASYEHGVNGLPDWSGSSGWLSRWKVCHNINYRCISDENATIFNLIFLLQFKILGKKEM